MNVFVTKRKWPSALSVWCALVCSMNGSATQDRRIAEDVAGGAIGLRYEGRLLDAEIRKVPLGVVAKSLRTKAAVQVLFNGPAIAEEPISASIRGRSIEQGIKILLTGFSYALHSSALGHTVVVLSTPPRRKSTADAIAVLDTDNIATAAAPANGPQTLDEFRALASLADGDTIDDSGDDAAALTDETQTREGMLQRALDVLKSPHYQLYADAIDQLGMLHDQRATDTLITLAQQGPGRYLATEAVARIAAQGQFEDPNTVTVLQRLASDPEDDVRRSAAQALEQMRQVYLAVRGH